MPEQAKSCAMNGDPGYDRDALAERAEADKAREMAEAGTDVEVVPADAPILGRDAILAVVDQRVVPVYVQEWGGLVHVRLLTGAERDRFEATLGRSGGERVENLRARFAALVLCDKDGKALFVAADIDALAKKSALALDKVFEAGAALNGIGQRAVEGLAKN